MKISSHVAYLSFAALLLVVAGALYFACSDRAVEKAANAPRSLSQESDSFAAEDSLGADATAPVQDRWSDAQVIAEKRLAFPEERGALLKRIVKRPGGRYPILVEEKIRLAEDGLEIEERKILSEKAADHFMVVPRARISREALEAELFDRGLILGDRVSKSGPYLVFIAEKDQTTEAVSAIVADLNGIAYSDMIEFADYDYVRQATAVPDDALYQSGAMWGLHNDGSIGGSVEDADIDAPEGWEIRTDASNIVVAIVDTGMRYTHEDLAGNMWVNADEIAGNGIDDDGNGFVDDIHGINALLSSKLSTGGDPLDDNGHGSHVAGTVGAVGNNGKGVTGVAWDVQLMALKFLGGNGSGMDSDAIKCIDYAIANGADIINASWGGPGVNKAVGDAVSRANDAGVIFVASAGNGSDDIDVEAYTPSDIDLPNVVSVANHNSADKLDRSSNYGIEKVDLIAPGARVRSVTNNTDESYGDKSGTSMSAPHVSGILALVKAEFPGEDYISHIERVLQSAIAAPQYELRVATGGRANLAGALSPGDLAPSAPSLTTLSNANEKVAFSWGNVWSGPIDGFRIERQVNGDAWEVVGVAAPSDRSFFDKDVGTLSNHRYRVFAFNSIGDSLASRIRVLNSVIRSEEEATIVLPMDDAGIDYGHDIDASSSTLVVGAPKDDDAGSESGSVYVYDRVPGSSWQYRQKVIGFDSSQYDFFGCSVSVDGPILAVGAFGEDEIGIDGGAVYVFERSEDGRWSAGQKLLAPDGESQDRFGFSVSVYGNLLVASSRDDDDSGTNSGAAHIFERSELGEWLPQAKLVPPNGSPRAYFGWSVALHGDVLVVGAKGDDEGGTDMGAIYVYQKSGGSWGLSQKIVPDDGSNYDGFGSSVDFDGASIVVGSPNRDGAAFDAGAIYLYRSSGSSWAHSKTFMALDPDGDDRFGSDVSVLGNRVAAIGLRAGDTDTVGHLFEESAPGVWVDEIDLFEDGVSALSGRSVALSEGVANVGNADLRRLHSFYDIPDAPLSFAIEEISAQGVRMSWGNSGDASHGFVIQRRVVGDDEWEEIGIVSANESGYLDPTAKGNRAWEYRVSAVSGGVSDASVSDQTALLPTGRLVNLSVRGYVGVGERVLVSGFSAAGSGDLEIGVRARGPFLLNSNILNAIADPQLSIVPLGGVEIASNDDWFNAYSSEAMSSFEAETGAAPIALFASEAVFIGPFSSGGYTVVMDDEAGRIGLGLAEVFEVPIGGEFSEDASLVNLSARGFVGTDSDVLIGGFVVSGEASVQLLIRGVGPGLIDFGLVDVVENPRITVHDANGTPMVSNSGWGLDGRMAEIENRSAQVGAFPLERGAKDAALIVTLAPGVYTCILDSTDGDTGVGLLELYVVP